MAINPHNQKLLDKYEYYLDNDVDENKKRKNTRKAYYTDIAQFLEYLDSVKAEDAKYENGVDWLKSLKGIGGEGLSAASKNRKKASVRVFYKYLKSMNIINHDPFILLTPETIVKGEDGNQAIRDILGEPEINRFKKVLENEVKSPRIKRGCNKKYVKINALRWRALFNLMLESGMRIEEVCSLERNQVRIDSQKGEYIYIPISKSKNKKARNIPIPSIVVDYIKEYRNEIPFEPDNNYVFVSQTGCKLRDDIVGDKLREFAELAKINKHLTPHSLRHTFASRKLNIEHIPSTVVAGWLGHYSGTMLEKIYYHQEEMDGDCAI